MTRPRMWMTGGVAICLVAAVIGLGVYHSRQDTRPTTPAVAGQTVTESSVTEALTAKKCTFLTRAGDPDAMRTVVLVSRTGAMADLGLPSALLTELVKTAGGAGKPVGSLTLMTVGGGNGEQPRVVLNQAALSDPTAGTERSKRLAEQLPECLATALEASTGPAQAGSDELRAQQLAARTANTQMFVVSDGEANTGLLDLRTQNYPYGDPGVAVASIRAGGQLPNFAGRHVTYYGIGQNRSEAERSWLTTFYSELCQASGGTCTIANDIVPVSEDASRTVPDDPPLTAISAIAHGPSTVYRVDSASFKARSTDLVDKDAVTAALRNIAGDADRLHVRSVSVYGHACDDGSSAAALLQISEDRAQKIAALLRQLGLAATITATGLGAQDPIAGPEPDGTFTSAQCAANRRVEIVVS